MFINEKRACKITVEDKVIDRLINIFLLSHGVMVAR